MIFQEFEKLYLQQYTVQEKRAMCIFFMEAAHADNKIHPKEVEVINEIFSVINITKTDLEASQSIPMNSALDLLSRMSEIKRIYFGKCLANIIIADGNISPEENELWNIVNSRVKCEAPD